MNNKETQTHPYQNIPSSQHWHKSVSSVAIEKVDPVTSFAFQVKKSDKVATAGSCFAQHIARYLSKSGFNYFIAEPGHPLLSPSMKSKYHYDTFSARYGNIYTSRQLLQLIEQAYGHFAPTDIAWKNNKGRWFDPYRPNIQPNGFESQAELIRDRQMHLACVKKMFEDLDVFVFTLGLTEVWINSQDGAAYPICPGTACGSFDSEKHKFLNLTVEEVVKDMEVFFEHLKKVNDKAKIILTVSPVPLMATAESRHVIQSTTLSKSILRVAADILSTKHSQVSYFPSYEIITANYSRGSYYAEDLRSVKENGVKKVMTLFLKHATETNTTNENTNLSDTPETKNAEFEHKMQEVVEVICDENAYK